MKKDKTNKKRGPAKLLSLVAITSMIALVGCTSTSQANTTSPVPPAVEESAPQTDLDQDLIDLLAEKVEYTQAQEYSSWADQPHTVITLSQKQGVINGNGAEIKNGVLTIKEAGTYVLSGDFTGSVTVDALKDEDVRIVLNNAKIASTTTAPIQVVEANAVTISLEPGTSNTLSDSAYGSATNINGDEITGAIFSKSDLIINGDGELTIQANNNDGINSRDDLMILSGNIQINAADDGLVGKDSVQIKNPTLNITAKGDGIKASNDTDAGQGYLLIQGGDITVNSGDDGLKGEQQMIITGGQINVQDSVEGLESMDILIAGGDIKVKSSDDGINAAGKDQGNTLDIRDGIIYVNAQGDGIDVNGSITMSGGFVVIDGPTSGGNGAIDYDQTFEITGGNLVAAGSAQMAQTPSKTSAQNSISFSFASTQQPGSHITLKDSSGQVIAESTPAKTFQNVVFSNDQIVAGQNYSIHVEDKQIVEFAAAQGITYANESGITQGGQGGLGAPGSKGNGGGKGAVPPGGFGNDQPPAPPNQNGNDGVSGATEKP